MKIFQSNRARGYKFLPNLFIFCPFTSITAGEQPTDSYTSLLHITNHSIRSASRIRTSSKQCATRYGCANLRWSRRTNSVHHQSRLRYTSRPINSSILWMAPGILYYIQAPVRLCWLDAGCYHFSYRSDLLHYRPKNKSHRSFASTLWFNISGCSRHTPSAYHNPFLSDSLLAIGSLRNWSSAHESHSFAHQHYPPVARCMVSLRHYLADSCPSDATTASLSRKGTILHV